jgi:hypothetical protein
MRPHPSRDLLERWPGKFPMALLLDVTMALSRKQAELSKGKKRSIGKA